MNIRGPFMFLTGFAFVLAAGWIGFPAVLYKTSEQPFQFNHRAHKEKGSMACADCHLSGDDGSFGGIPKAESCAGCHVQPLGSTQAEKMLVDQFVTPSREINWYVYAQQPMNVRFSHVIHTARAKLKCEECHGAQGTSDRLRAYQANRITGYSRDIWGANIARIGLQAHEGMKMTDCEDCHAQHGVEAGCLGCHK